VQGAIRTIIAQFEQLGTATAVMTLAYIEAVARIPLGTTAAIEFLGPLELPPLG
jgi:inner membrane transporter RhtA